MADMKVTEAGSKMVPQTETKKDSEIKEQFAGILGVLSSFRAQITMLQNQLRGLEKNVNKKMRVLHREAKKNRNKGNRKPSGIAVQTNGKTQGHQGGTHRGNAIYNRVYSST